MYQWLIGPCLIAEWGLIRPCYASGISAKQGFVERRQGTMTRDDPVLQVCALYPVAGVLPLAAAALHMR